MIVQYRWLDSLDDAHIDLRFRVLRIGRPKKTALYPGIDDDPRTKFIGAFLGAKMVGCATIQYDPKDDARLRIRGMAVDSEYRNRGIGSKIVRMIQNYAEEMETGLWCNARIKAVTMYQRAGFNITSDLFEIESVGPHFEVRWNPNNRVTE